jgi:hypothetical protein
MSDGWLELIFLMLVMKLPIAYLVAVVWWAVRAEPRPEEPAAVTVVTRPDSPQPTTSDPRVPGRLPRSPRPHGGPTRKPARVASASAKAERP